jgi:VCBS repeat-containing protein
MNYLIGHQIEQYRLEAVLGDGGMGTVYRAYDLQGDRLVAIKMMSTHLAQKPAFQRRFAQEAQATHNFNSPHIVRVYQSGEYQGIPYMVMEHIAGGSLTDYLRQLKWAGRQIPLDEAIALAAQVAEGLSYAHQRGIIHRDIKPDNILLRQQSGSSAGPKQAVITDFGLAVLLKEGEEVSTNPFMGSLPYMSPEQCSNLPLDGRSDLYSLGVMLYQLTTGQLPFRIEAPADIIKHLQETPLPPRLVNPHLPQLIEDIVLKTLAKKPGDRFQTGAEIAHKLRSIDLQVASAARTAVSADSAVTQWIENRWIAGVDVPNRVDINRTWTSAGDYRLFITHQWEEARVESLSGGIVTIGRHPGNTIVLNDRSVSVHHARLESTATGWRIVDLGSTNGSTLDERKLEYNQPADWASHQTLRIGQYALQWQAFASHAQGREVAAMTAAPIAAAALLAATPAAAPSPPPAATNGQSNAPAGAAALAVAGAAVLAATRQPTEWDDPDLGLVHPGQTLELTLNPATLEIAPGAVTQIQLRVLNLGATVEDINLYALEHGQSPTWIALRASQIKLLPGESDTITLDVAPPQDSTVLAGSHPIELFAATSRGVTETTSGVVNVARWEEFSLDMHPRNLQEKINCRLTIADQGNFANVYRLEGSDDSEQLTFDFAPPQNATLVDYGQNQQQIRIQPGNSSVLTFTIQPKRRPWFRAPSRPFPFKIRTRTETSDWQTLDGQVSIRPRFSLRFLIFVLLLLLLMLLLGFAAVSRVRANAAQREMEMRDSFSATATAVRATLSVFEGAVDSAQATADALRAAGDITGAESAQATADALRATLVAQNAQLDQVSAQLQITPTPVPVPVDITLDITSVPENAPIGTTVGTFTTALDAGETSAIPRTPAPPISQNNAKPNIQARLLQQTGPRITYSLVSGSGDTDNAAFFIEGSSLKTARRFDFETKSSYSVRVRADNGAGGTFERSFTISVVDLPDTPTLSITDVTVDEGVGTAVIALTMTNDSNSIVSVEVSTADGTARQGEDYTPFEGTVRWQPGETGRKTIEIPIIDDQLDEPDETFSVRLGNPVIGVINTGTATVTILDNDDPPSLSIADLTISEGAGQAVLVVTLSGLSSREVSVSYVTADGTAKANEDYTAASGTLVWRAGETGPKNLSVIILDDQIFEASETFAVNLSSAANATLERSTATVTIEENDPPPVVSIVQTLTVDEPTDADGNAFLTATMDRASSINVTVNYATSDDTAVKGRDYVETSGSITWQAGETGIKSIPVVIKADRIKEANETFIVTLSNPVNATLGNAIARVTISDSDDLPSVQVLGDVIITEGPEVRARVQVRLNGGSSTPVSVGYVTENGTAVADQDFRPVPANALLTWNAEESDTIKEIFIDLLDDRIDEPDETFSVILNSVPTNNASLATQNRAIITIQDNDPAPTLQLRTSSVGEGSGQPAIEVRLFGGSHQNVEVAVSVTDGTAVSGQDYTFTPVPPLAFPANEVDRVLSFPIRILDDQIFEPGEGETINIALTPNPDTGVAPLSGVIRITDNDVVPTLRITNSSLEVNEGTSPNNTVMTVTVMLERGINRAVTAVVNTEDITARANVDYVPISNLALVFPANAINTIRSFPVQIIADAVDEANEERFRVRITTPDDPDVGDTTGVITILDDDVAGLVVTPTTLEVSEGDITGVTYSARLTSVPTSTVTLTIDPDDQLRLAAPSLPLVAPGQPIVLTFPANNSALTPQIVTVVAVDDSLVEGPHTALITHLSSSADPLYQGRAQNVTVNITDNDLPPVITPEQVREVSEIAQADAPIGSVVLATVRSTSGSLQDWTIVSVSPVTATTYFAIDRNGQLLLTAVGAGNLDREGPVISYTLALTVSDGFSVSDPPENLVINILDANDEIPVIPPQSRDVAEDNGAGPFGAPLTATDPDVTPTVFQDWTITSVSPGDATGYFAINPTTGQLSLTAVGAANIDFETPPNAYQLQVTVSDGVNTSADQTITVNVTDANDPPVGVDDAYNATEDVTLSVPAPGVLANDTDIDAAGDILTVVAVNGSPSVGQSVLLDSGALLQMFADGRFTYNTNGAYDALATGQIGTDSFAYTVGDGNGGTDTATVTITITGTNDNPRAVADSGATLQDQILLVAPRGVLTNDTDPDSDPANFVVIAVNGGAANVGNQITLSSGALLTLNANGGYSYNPNGVFNYLAVGQTATDNFTYTLSDGAGGSDIGTVTITVTGVNDPPTAVNDTGTTTEDTTLTVPAPGVLGNDTDPDGDTLTVTAVGSDPSAVGTQIELYPSGALLTLNANGSYSYNPNGQFNYLAVGQTATDSFTYTASDGNGGSANATVTITITGVNDPPTAVADSGATTQDVILSVTAPGVLANDTDPDDGDQANLTVTAVNGSTANVGVQIATSKNGLVTLNANGSYIYNPNGAFNQLPQGATDSDSFNYTVSDGNGGSAVGIVTITITGVNDAPILNNITASRTYTEGMSLVVLAPGALISDIDNPPNLTGVLTVTIITGGTTTDQLGIDSNSLPSGYNINAGQSSIRRNPNTTIANFNANPAAWPVSLTLTFTSNATQTDIQAVLQAIYFNNTVDNPSGPPNPDVTPREIRFTYTDTLGAVSNQPIVTINVVAVRHDGGLIVAQSPDHTDLVLRNGSGLPLTRRYDDPNPS